MNGDGAAKMLRSTCSEILNKYILGLELGSMPHMTFIDMDIHHNISQPNFAQDDKFKKT